MSCLLLFLLLVSDSTAVDEMLARAGFNRETWEEIIVSLEGVEKERALYLLEELPILDLMETETQTILNHVHLCTVGLSFHPDYSPPEDTTRAYNLWPSTGFRDFVTDWRPQLQTLLRDHIGENVGATAESVVTHLSRRVQVNDREDIFGPPSPPLATFRRGWGTRREFASLVVAGLRSVGLAARLAREGDGAEIWMGEKWEVVLSSDVQQDAQQEESPTANAALEMRLRQGAGAYLSEEGIGLAKWSEGKWEPILPPETPMKLVTTESTMVLTTVPGRYLFTAGIRNARGEPRIWCKEVFLLPDSTVTVNQDLEIPFAELSKEDLIEGEKPDLSDLVLYDSGDTPQNVALPRLGIPSILIAVQAGAEPSERLLRRLEDKEAALRTANADIVLVYIGNHGIDGALLDKNGALRNALGLRVDETGAIKGLPVAIVYSEAGELLLKKSGYNPRIPDLIAEVLRVRKEEVQP